MNWRPYWESLRRWYNARAPREQRLVQVWVVAVGLSLFYLIAVRPVVAFRQGLAEQIAAGQDKLEQDARFLGALDSLEKERSDLKKRLDREKAKLLPGDSGTLAAAGLQERANSIATEKGITVQSTQVMRDEVAEPFRKVSVRLTVSGELKPFADFVKDLEFAPDEQLTIPFVEITRRGAVGGAKGPRTLSGTIEINGYLLAAAKAPPEGEAQPGSETEAPAAGAESEAPSAEGHEAGTGAPAVEAPAVPAAPSGAEAPPTTLPAPAGPPAGAKETPAAAPSGPAAPAPAAPPPPAKPPLPVAPKATPPAVP